MILMCIYSHYLLLILYLELILSHRIIKRFDTKSSIYKGCVSSIFIVDKNNSLIHNCASKFDTVFQELNSQDKRQAITQNLPMSIDTPFIGYR